MHRFSVHFEEFKQGSVRMMSNCLSARPSIYWLQRSSMIQSASSSPFLPPRSTLPHVALGRLLSQSKAIPFLSGKLSLTAVVVPASQHIAIPVMHIKKTYKAPTFCRLKGMGFFLQDTTSPLLIPWGPLDHSLAIIALSVNLPDPSEPTSTTS